MKIYCVIISLLLITSCNSIKRSRLLTSGEVAESVFYDSVHFNYQGGFPIIKVAVNGIEGSFLFDTGAPNVISAELAEKLNLKTIATGRISDSGGNVSRKEKYVKLNNIQIGSVNFANTGAVIIDLNSAHKINCLNLDGIVGANLMRHASWKINYEKQIIYFSNDLLKHNLTDEYIKVNFKSRFSGTPIVNFHINNKDSVRMIIDTGSNGKIGLPFSAYKRPSEKKQIQYCVGTSTYGVNGRAKADSTFYLKAAKIGIGNLLLNNKILQYRGHSDLIGNGFLENYTLVLDWENNNAYFKRIKEYDFNELNHFGFKLDYENGRMLVSALFNHSFSYDILEIGDEVLRIDNVNFENYSDQNYCDLVMKDILKLKYKDVINIKIKRGEKVFNHKLQKSQLLQ